MNYQLVPLFYHCFQLPPADLELLRTLTHLIRKRNVILLKVFESDGAKNKNPGKVVPPGFNVCAGSEGFKPPTF